MIYAILLIVFGLLAVPSLVIAKKPDAKELFDKVAPFMGWIGVVALLNGIWDLTIVIRNLGALSNGVRDIVLLAFFFAVALVQLALGFIMAYGLINKYVLSKNPQAQAKGAATLAKLVPLQGRIGIGAIILGIIYVILLLVW
jgi:hypothetical protein